MTTHSTALAAFARNLQWVLTLRLAVQMATVWLFAWGVVILALRILGVQNVYWLTMGLLAVAPLALIAAWRARQQRASFTRIRASYDQLNACGGIIMSAETQDMGAWMAQLPGVAVPRPRWRSGRPLLMLSTSAAFVLIALLLPSRFTHLPGRRPLEIGQIVGQLKAEVSLLTQEKIINPKKSDELKKQLSQLQDDSLGYDPSKTWEALDHIKQSDSDAAQQAAQEALNKTTSMTEAETVAKAMEQASDSGMDAATASQAAQDLASMLNAAQLDYGLLNVQIPPKLLAGLSGLNKQQMEKLLQNLESNKSLLSMDISNLVNLKMIDPATLANLRIAGVCDNPDALAKYLRTCTNCDKAMLCMHCKHPTGLARGGPGADMTWSDGASEKDLKFQEHALPPSPHLSQAMLIGVSKTAPELSSSDVSAQHGALDNTAAGGGSANAQVILPEQRQAVQNYFKRQN